MIRGAQENGTGLIFSYFFSIILKARKNSTTSPHCLKHLAPTATVKTKIPITKKLLLLLLLLLKCDITNAITNATTNSTTTTRLNKAV